MGFLKRREDWPQRLAEAVEAARTKPFAWASVDCCLWAADVILAMTGTDLAAEYRGRYQDEAGAYRLLRQVSGGGVEAAATRALGEPLSRPLLAQRGDVVLVGQPTPLLGICIGRDVAAVKAEGLAFLPITKAVKAWRV